jgi:hypothetical protein
MSPALGLGLAGLLSLATAYLVMRAVRRALEREAQRVASHLVPFPHVPVARCERCGLLVGLSASGELAVHHVPQTGEMCSSSGRAA